MSLRSFFGPSPSGQRKRRAVYGHTTRRSHFEMLEDRCLLSLTPAVGYGVGSAPQAVVTADFNNDGTLDVATANSNIGPANVSVLLGGANGTFGPAIDYPADYAPISIAVGDFDDDGNLDLAMVNGREHEYWLPYTEDAVSVMFGNGDGSFQPPSYIRSGPGYTEPKSVAVGDFNGDGTMDLAVAEIDHSFNDRIFGQASVLLSNGDRTFDEPRIAVHMGNPAQSITVADFNDDGNQDLVVGEYGIFVRVACSVTARGILLPIPVPTGTWAMARRWPLATSTAMVTPTWWRPTTPKSTCGSATASSGFEPSPGGHSYAAGDGPTSIVLGDFDRDGRLDIATANHDSNDVSILRGRGDGTFLAAEHFAVGPAASTVAAADFNGDGVVDSADYVVWRKFDGTTDGYNAWRGELRRGPRCRPAPLAVTAGDFNGDGWVDFATANASGNSVSILFNDQTWEPLPPASAYSGAVIDSPASQSVLPGADARSEESSANPPVAKFKEAVEVRGASEKQRATMERDSAFVELLARPARSRGEFRHTVRSSPVATAAIEASRPDDALLMWLSPSDSKQVVTEWENGNELDDDEANNAADPVFESIDEVFALLAIG